MGARDSAWNETERDLIRLGVLDIVAAGPVMLGEVVSRIEGLVMGEMNGTPRGISRSLHEMQRDGEIILAADGRRWRVSLGPKGRTSLERLKAGGISPLGLKREFVASLAWGGMRG